jgi:hypothetical protein
VPKLLLAVALLWWQEVSWAVARATEISANKAGRWSFTALALGHVAGRVPWDLIAMLPRWKMAARAISASSFYNKVGAVVYWVVWGASSSPMSPACRGGEGRDRHGRGAVARELLLAGRGGEEEKRRCPAFLALRWWRSFLLGRKLVAAFSAPLSCGRGGRLREEKRSAVALLLPQRDGGVQRTCAPEADGAPKRRRFAVAILCGKSRYGLNGPCIVFLQARVPNRRIFFDRPREFIAGEAPSGLFPGGNVGSRRRRSCICGGKDQGPDCFQSFCSRVLFVFAEALSVISWFVRGLSAYCIDRFDY